MTEGLDVFAFELIDPCHLCTHAEIGREVARRFEAIHRIRLEIAGTTGVDHREATRKCDDLILIDPGLIQRLKVPPLSIGCTRSDIEKPGNGKWRINTGILTDPIAEALVEVRAGEHGIGRIDRILHLETIKDTDILIPFRLGA